VFIGTGYLEKLAMTFFIVFSHEMAHTAVSILFKYKIKEIEFFPFGGVARIDGMVGIEPQKEISIDLAGPIVNLAMAAIVMGISPLTDVYSLRGYFISANLSVALFNLLPIFPLDGGRIVRSYLSKGIGIKRATNLIIGISKFFALCIFGWGSYLAVRDLRGVYIALLAVFIFISANKERHMTAYLFMKEVNDRKDLLFKRGVLKGNYIVSIEHTQIGRLLEEFIPNKYHVIAVVNSKGQIIGSLTEEDITKGAFNFGLTAPISVLLYNRKKW